MEYTVRITEVLTVRLEDTYDFSSSIDQVKAIDQAMRHYFGTNHWLAMRNQFFPGLRSKA